MNNIWKYSLVLAFSIIIDQMLKGTAQSLISTPGTLENIGGPLFFARVSNPLFPFGVNFVPQYANTICWISHLILIIYCLKKIVYFRNRNPFRGWGMSFILMSSFTNWLDRYSQGKTLNYLAIGTNEQHISFSFGDLSLILGLLILLISFLKEKRKEESVL